MPNGELGQIHQDIGEVKGILQGFDKHLTSINDNIGEIKKENSLQNQRITKVETNVKNHTDSHKSFLVRVSIYLGIIWTAAKLIGWKISTVVNGGG